MTNFFKAHSLKLAISILSLGLSSAIFADSIPLAKLNLQNKKVNDQFSFEEMKNSLWSKYLKDVQTLQQLKTEYAKRELKFENKAMLFSLEKRGVAPKGGYPLYIALHGGGQASSPVNDSEWRTMQFYYRDSIKDGIYVAPRGITDNWNLHFEAESYPLYDKLIESAILFDNVNPDKVYLLGFSAGGDGVYQVVPRMPDRFAAANMSAGHHNWIGFDNLYNTPFLMQVGELDDLYNRNRVAAENYKMMFILRAAYQGGYTHDLFMHYKGYHNTWEDNDAKRGNHDVIADPIAWLEWGIRTRKLINTNAIDWLNHYTRQSTPQKLVWNLAVSADKRDYQVGKALAGKEGYQVKLAPPKTLFYWLDVSVADSYPEKGLLVVEAIKSSNTIKVLEAKNVDKFRILLNPYLLDLASPVKVEINNKVIGQVHVQEKTDIMIRTMLERSDKNEIYDAQITLAYNKANQSWQIV